MESSGENNMKNLRYAIYHKWAYQDAKIIARFESERHAMAFHETLMNDSYYGMTGEWHQHDGSLTFTDPALNELSIIDTRRDRYNEFLTPCPSLEHPLEYEEYTEDLDKGDADEFWDEN